MVKAIVLCVLILTFAAPGAAAFDAGVIIGQDGLIERHGEEDLLREYRASASPWIAAPLGRFVDLHVSTTFRVQYTSDEWSPLFLLNRAELGIAPTDTLHLALGRAFFRDNLGGLVMGGFFDGAMFAWNTPLGRFDAGLFYTGLQHKDTVSINMTEHDHSLLIDDENYFASRRIGGGVSWGQTGIFETGIGVQLGAYFQFDVNDAEERLHSQYLMLGLTVPVGRSIHINLGAAGSLIQETERDTLGAFAGIAEVRHLHFLGRTNIPGMWSLIGHYASGEREGYRAFMPLSAPGRGMVLRPTFSGIALAQTGYSLRLHRSLFVELFAALLFRTDTATFFAPGIDSDSPSGLLGPEFFGTVSWSPFSDLMFMASGGVFVPQWGRVFTDDILRYRLDLMVNISL